MKESDDKMMDYQDVFNYVCEYTPTQEFVEKYIDQLNTRTFELGRRRSLVSNREIIVNCSEKTYQYYKPILADLNIEEFHVLLHVQLFLLDELVAFQTIRLRGQTSYEHPSP